MIEKSENVLNQLKKGLLILLILGVVCEMVFFPTLANFYGCLMAIISYVVFSYFLKREFVVRFPFAFFMYLSMFMYRYLPLIATIAEGKPITYGFERPFETFFYEIILFLVSSLAFFLACEIRSKRKNNIIQKNLIKLNFFEITPHMIWVIGFFGLLIRLYNFSAGDVEYGDVQGKFLLGLDYLVYAPLTLVFPSLMRIKYKNQKIVWFYGTLIFIINLASNSRRQMLLPIGIISLLFLLYIVVNNLKITSYLSPIKIIFLGLFLIFGLNLLSNASTAMLHTRKIRANVEKIELFEETIKVLKDDALMMRLKAKKEENIRTFISYHKGWTEDYVDNFMLARYANMRITDQTLYYAEKKGYGNKQMQILFKDNLLALFPTPWLHFFGIYLDKNKLQFSRGDFLYGSGFGGRRVTSHVGDGLATFGYWYFLIQFFAFFIIFKLLNCFVYFAREGLVYAPFALMNVFDFLGMFRNALGVTGDISYIIRGFVQGILTYLIILYIARNLLGFVNKKYITVNKSLNKVLS